MDISTAIVRQCFLAAVLLCPLTALHALELEPCVLTAAGGRIEVAASCGMLSVPLNPDKPQGEQIELFVARVAALSENPQRDPMTVITGGPGQASTTWYAQLNSAFSRIRRTRDIFVVDQRGTGKSAPLFCKNIEGDEALAYDPETIAQLGIECLDALDHDPRYFTTSVAVRDLDTVREALGYGSMNIYAVSYGTRVAQHYLRRYPERTRTVILDGVVPPGLALGPGVAIESQRALDQLFERCAAEDACATEHPNIAARFAGLLDRLRDSPVTVTLSHPRTGAQVAVMLTHHHVAGVVRLLIYAPQNAGLIPQMIELALDGDYVPFASQLLMIKRRLDGEISHGMNFAVVCTEDEPFFGPIDREAQSQSYLGPSQVDALQTICGHWPRGMMDEDFRDALATATPALLLSGDADPITPPAYAERAAQGLSNHRHLRLPYQGHGQLATGCMPRLMAEFVDSADPDGLDASCLEGVRPFPIFTSTMGPPP